MTFKTDFFIEEIFVLGLFSNREIFWPYLLSDQATILERDRAIRCCSFTTQLLQPMRVTISAREMCLALVRLLGTVFSSVK